MPATAGSRAKRTKYSSNKYGSTKKTQTGNTLVKRGQSKLFIPRPRVGLGQAMPDVLRSTIRIYANEVVLGAANTLQHSYIAVNDLYNPLRSLGTSTQPLYFDELMAIYIKYVVLSAKVRCRVSPNSTERLRVALWENDNNTVTPTMDGIMVQPKTASGVVMGTANEPLVLTDTYSQAKTKGRDLMANETATGTASTSPSNPDYMYLSVFGHDGSWSAFCEWFVEFDVLMYDRRDLNLSS